MFSTTKKMRFGGWLLAAMLGCFLATSAGAEEGYEEECFQCHGSKESMEDATDKKIQPGWVVEPGKLRGTIHEDHDCSECHVKPSADADDHYDGGPKLVLNCANCHDEAVEQFRTNDIHGKAFAEHNEMAPWCTDCHAGGHNLKPLSSPDSVLSPFNQPTLCGKCHGGIDFEHQPTIAKRKLVERYLSGVHWEKINEGLPAASCTDCHGHHSILPSSDRSSAVSREGLLRTCAKCHPSQTSTYASGSHGATLLHGNLDVPTCTTCHGDHDIASLKVQANGKRDFAATQVCMWCHGNDRIMARYALDTSPVDSYLNDFHGLSQRGSLGTSATCADCHDPHHSLPASHPKSRMHIDNRGAACGKCHGESSESFIMSFTHRKRGKDGSTRGRIVDIVTLVYIILIVVTLGGMALHNLIVWTYYVRLKRKYQEKKGAIVRMTQFERGWHWLLLASFTLLAITGFALSFSDTAPFRWFYSLGLSEANRAWLHRLNAILMTVDMGVFLVYKTVTRRGRMWWTQMWPRWRDVKDFWQNMKYHLWFSKKRVRFPMFNYGEKAEYWALWWGTAVMVLSGLVLWFSELLPAGSPPWVFEVCRVIHYYEAILATGAIIVWHLFNTILHPAEYPMDTCWLTGKLSEHEAHHRFDDEAIALQRPVSSEPVAPEPKEWLEAADAADDDAGSADATPPEKS
jgi:cytochrome b subunit of formate dehydrogenase